MQSPSNSEQEVLAILVEAIRKLGESSSDEAERKACSYWQGLLFAPPTQATEQAVRKLRDELEHFKSDFNDSLDRRQETLSLRQQARDAAKKSVNSYVLRRRPDLGSVKKT